MNKNDLGTKDLLIIGVVVIGGYFLYKFLFGATETIKKDLGETASNLTTVASYPVDLATKLPTSILTNLGITPKQELQPEQATEVSKTALTSAKAITPINLLTNPIQTASNVVKLVSSALTLSSTKKASIPTKTAIKPVVATKVAPSIVAYQSGNLNTSGTSKLISYAVSKVQKYNANLNEVK